MKFDKKKCLECKYHGQASLGCSTPVGKNKTVKVYCNYASITESTCLKRAPKGGVIDARGKGECRLFSKGKPVIEEDE